MQTLLVMNTWSLRKYLLFTNHPIVFGSHLKKKQCFYVTCNQVYFKHFCHTKCYVHVHRSTGQLLLTLHPLSFSLDLIKDVLSLDEEIQKLATELYQQKSVLIMGRGYHYATCLEGALVRSFSYFL